VVLPDVEASFRVFGDGKAAVDADAVAFRRRYQRSSRNSLRGDEICGPPVKFLVIRAVVQAQ